MYPYLFNFEHLNLQNSYSKVDSLHLKRQLQNIVTLTIRGVDTSHYFPEVVIHLTNSDLGIKKLVCWYISRTSTNVDNVLLLLVINSLVQNCKDPNPLVRCLAIKTLTSMQQSLVSEYAIHVILKNLNDENVFVRRAAILGCAKLHRSNQSLFSQHYPSVVQQLQVLLKDNDSVVLYNALNVLNEISLKYSDRNYENNNSSHDYADNNSGGAGLVVSKSLAMYLVSKLESFSNLHKPMILYFILRYEFKNPQETLQFMNALDKYFKKDQQLAACVTSSLTAAFVSMVTNHLPQLKAQVLMRSSDCLLGHLNSENNETTWCLLQFLKDFVVSNREIFNAKYKVFLCKSTDPEYLKVQKLKIVPHLITSSNFWEIQEDLVNLYNKNANIEIRTSIVKCFSDMSEMQDYKFRCLETILSFLKMKPIIEGTSLMLVELLRHDAFMISKLGKNAENITYSGNNDDNNVIGNSATNAKVNKAATNDATDNIKLDNNFKIFNFDVLKVVLDSLDRPGLSEDALIQSILFLGDFVHTLFAGNIYSVDILNTNYELNPLDKTTSNKSDCDSHCNKAKSDKMNPLNININDDITNKEENLICLDDADMTTKNGEVKDNYDGISGNKNDKSLETDPSDHCTSDDPNNLFAGIELPQDSIHFDNFKFANFSFCEKEDDSTFTIANIDQINQIHKQRLIEIPYRLERLLSKIERSLGCDKNFNIDEINSDVKLSFDYARTNSHANILSALLTTFTKLFVSQPGVCQHMLGRLLEMCSNVNEPNLNLKSQLYFYLLQNDLEIFKKFVIGSRCFY